MWRHSRIPLYIQPFIIKCLLSGCLCQSTKILWKARWVGEAEVLPSWSSQSVWPYASLDEGASYACFHSISYTLTLKIYRRIFYINRYLCKMCIKYFIYRHTHTLTRVWKELWNVQNKNSENSCKKRLYIFIYMCV